MSGFVVVFEGPDGGGKSTTAAMLVDRLRLAGRGAELVALPGNEPGTLGRLVHELHHEPSRFGLGEVNPTSLQVLHAAAHIDAIHRRIRPSVDAGKIVVMDRFWWSTIVYGRDLGADERSLHALELLARSQWATVQPAAAFVFATPAAGAGREESKAFERLSVGYTELVRSLRESFPVRILNTPATPEGRVLEVLQALRADGRVTLS